MRAKLYCSRECAFAHKVNKNASAWKGDLASYSAIHKWVTAKFGRPKLCVECNTSGKRMNWANISRKYKRVRNDWIELCAKCHKRFDLMSNLQRTFIVARWEKFTGKKAKLIPGK